ncbi:MAG: Ldh family oxidoreductase [Pikeienuella sp.]
MARITMNQATKAANAALVAHGAAPDHAAATANAVVGSEALGTPGPGLSHLPDYCDALIKGRAYGNARPILERITPALMRIDAASGFPHLGIEEAWDEMVAGVWTNGIGMLALRNGFTSGSLSYYAMRLAENHGLACLIAANAGPAVVPMAGGTKPLFSTNPIAFGMPVEGAAPVIIDQSASETAIVNIRQAAEEGREIPEGWALGPDGQPTTDPNEAMNGALLPYGGYRGANMALMVEMLAAGLTGAAWSHQAGSFLEGTKCPGVGLTIIAFDPAMPGGGSWHMSTLVAQMQQEPNGYIPGARKATCLTESRVGGMDIDDALWAATLVLADTGAEAFANAEPIAEPNVEPMVEFLGEPLVEFTTAPLDEFAIDTSADPLSDPLA